MVASMFDKLLAAEYDSDQKRADGIKQVLTNYNKSCILNPKLKLDQHCVPWHFFRLCSKKILFDRLLVLSIPPGSGQPRV